MKTRTNKTDLEDRNPERLEHGATGTCRNTTKNNDPTRGRVRERYICPGHQVTRVRLINRESQVRVMSVITTDRQTREIHLQKMKILFKKTTTCDYQRFKINNVLTRS